MWDGGLVNWSRSQVSMYSCVDPLTGYNRDFVKNIDLEKSKQGQVCLNNANMFT